MDRKNLSSTPNYSIKQTYAKNKKSKKVKLREEADKKRFLQENDFIPDDIKDMSDKKIIELDETKKTIEHYQPEYSDKNDTNEKDILEDDFEEEEFNDSYFEPVEYKP